jgi:hypothetical protein
MVNKIQVLHRSQKRNIKNVLKRLKKNFRCVFFLPNMTRKCKNIKKTIFLHDKIISLYLSKNIH